MWMRKTVSAQLSGHANRLCWSFKFIGLVNGFRDREAPEGILQRDQRQKSDQGQC